MIPGMVVPTLTRADLLPRMLDSIDVPVETLLVIANGGAEVRWNKSDRVGRMCVASIPDNLGVAASWNLGIKALFRLPWILIASDDVTFPPGELAKLAADAGPDRLTLARTWPYWCAFAFGLDAVDKVGLFDERLYPAYYEDTEWAWRAEQVGFPIVTSDARVDHDNASTLNTPGRQFAAAKHQSDLSNGALFAEKKAKRDLTPGDYELWRWRLQAW